MGDEDKKPAKDEEKKEKDSDKEEQEDESKDDKEGGEKDGEDKEENKGDEEEDNEKQEVNEEEEEDRTVNETGEEINPPESPFPWAYEGADSVARDVEERHGAEFFPEGTHTDVDMPANAQHKIDSLFNQEP